MTSAVAINFTNCNFTSNQSTIVIGNGSIDISAANQIQASGTFTFSTLTISTTQITFDNNTVGGTVSGLLSIPINPAGTAALTVNNFVGQATAVWGNGGFAVVAPSEPVILIGLS